VRRIKCGGGEDGEPALSPLGWKAYASCVFPVSFGGTMSGYASRHRPHG
jgi:hypothetical protein